MSVAKKWPTAKPAPIRSMALGSDAFGNARRLLAIHHRHDRRTVLARSTVRTAPEPGPDPAKAKLTWGEFRKLRRLPLYWDFTRDSRYARSSPARHAFADRCGIAIPESDPLMVLRMLSAGIHQAFEFVPGSTSATSPAERILESGRGVCQDYDQVMITLPRAGGLSQRAMFRDIFISPPAMAGPRGRRLCTHGSNVACRTNAESDLIPPMTAPSTATMCGWRLGAITAT